MARHWDEAEGVQEQRAMLIDAIGADGRVDVSPLMSDSCWSVRAGCPGGGTGSPSSPAQLDGRPSTVTVVDALDGQVRVPSPLVELGDKRLGSVRVLLKRDDLTHPHVVGNKWRKLKYLLPEAIAAGASTLLTFGGAYSNHVRAVAAAGKALGFATIGVIRGEERPSNQILEAAVRDGMHLHYLDRTAYRRKDEPDVVAMLRAEFGRFFLIPEGGTTIHAVRGCAELVAEIEEGFDLIMTPVGTGGTLAGIATGLSDGQHALGISVLKGAVSLNRTVDRIHRDSLGHEMRNWSIDHRWHHGGFARRSPGLDIFLADFEKRHGLRLDHVYVGKMLFGLFAMAAAEEIPARSTVVAVVTGAVPDARSNRHSPHSIS